MKIFIITGLFPPDIGGPATYSKLLFEKLPRCGNFEMSVLSFGQVRHLPKVARHIAFFFKILFRGQKADVLFAQDPVSVGLPALFASLILGKPLVLKVVGDYAWEQGILRFGVKDSLDEFVLKKHKHPLVRFFCFLERQVASRALKVIVPSEYLKGIVEKWGIKKSKITVIYNGFTAPSDLEPKEKIRERLAIFETTIASAGRLVPWKGFSRLIDVVASFKKRGKKLKLLIIGEGPERMSLARQIELLGLSEDVFLLGKLPPHVAQNYIRASDIFVLNSGYEGFSHQLLEVLGVGTPVIATDVGGNKEIIINGKNGFLIEGGDEGSLSLLIEKLLAEKELREKFIFEGNKSLIKFSEDIMLSKTAVFFQSL